MSEYGSVLDGYIVPGEPLVSVSVIAYNHGKYIRQCLDGILMQKVNFPYEVLVHDDASPDDTADIIREYEARFPTVIKPIYQRDNQYSQGKDVGKFNIDRAKGKYIAQCEGDDYWTDSGKLQMQVDFLEEHSGFSGTTHHYTCVNKNNTEILPWTHDLRQEIQTKDILRQYELVGQSATLVYRNYFAVMNSEIKDRYYHCRGYGDWKLNCLLLAQGPVYCFQKPMSAYRHVVIDGTSYSATTKGNNVYGINYISFIDITRFIHDYYHIDLGLQEIAFCIMAASFIKYITHPNEMNKNVIKTIHKENKNNNWFKKSIIKSMINHPLSVMQIINKIRISKIQNWKNRDIIESYSMQIK